MLTFFTGATFSFADASAFLARGRDVFEREDDPPLAATLALFLAGLSSSSPSSWTSSTTSERFTDGEGLLVGVFLRFRVASSAASASTLAGDRGLEGPACGTNCPSCIAGVWLERVVAYAVHFVQKIKRARFYGGCALLGETTRWSARTKQHTACMRRLVTLR